MVVVVVVVGDDYDDDDDDDDDDDTSACCLTSPAESVVGVHVRHGDKKTESAIIPIEQYLDAAKVRLLVQQFAVAMVCCCNGLLLPAAAAARASNFIAMFRVTCDV